jgi:Ribbon-helix-helix protein, copG family
MPDKPDERLIILLPPDLLEEVRRVAEEADLSVSQLVRRAIRNELQSLHTKRIADALASDKPVDLVTAVKNFSDALNLIYGKASASGIVPGGEPESKSETLSPTNAKKILRVLRDRK